MLVTDELASCVSALGQYEQELRDARKHLARFIPSKAMIIFLW